ncbi:hypothetical protein [uncultured Pseudacidovorax sp.]|uniref:hypothetical protein n=1 Tax=uncultured Pseudacidovorax sp. TaxID=679313 RepID=UPI0025D9B080|nr:hypothetical protein [uncultured Pseudacidovorax sp.]
MSGIVSPQLQSWATAMAQGASPRATIEGMRRLGVSTDPQLLLLSPAASTDVRCLLAAEQLVHLVDGWRYAAAAMSAFLTHSNAAALHFAYYAELRAAISLMSWGGLRAKWHDYYYLDASGVRHTPHPTQNPPTHKAVWLLWREWAQKPDVEQLLLDNIRLMPNVYLRSVIGAVNFTLPHHALQQWGADLFDPSDDHDARNTASYQPILTNTDLTSMNVGQTNLVKALWELLLSQGYSLQFDSAFCAHLVNLTGKHLGPSGQPNFLSPNYYENLAQHIASETGAPGDEIRRRIDPLKYNFLPFDLASSNNTDVENVLCRSILLLRIALLATQNSLDSPGASSVPKKWLNRWLEHAGLWSQDQGIDPQDIHFEYSDALESFTTENPLPLSLWDRSNSWNSAALARPDACIAWSLTA